MDEFRTFKRRAAANASSRLLLFTHTTTSLLCPVAAIEAHNFRIAYSACIAKHLVFSNQQLHRFLRSIQAHSIPIGAKRISHNIKQIMIRVKNPAQAPVPMARGLAATLAAQASVSMDNIIAHGSWYSCDIFKHYYRLSSATFTNFSVSTLDQQPRSRLTKSFPQTLLIKLNISSQNTSDNTQSSYQKREIKKYWGDFWPDKVDFTLCRISDIIQMPKSSVQKVIDRIREAGSPLSKKVSGASRKLCERSQRHLERIIRRSPFVSYDSVRFKLQHNLPTNTISYRSKQEEKIPLGLRSCRLDLRTVRKRDLVG
ncbi:hypothetical protein CU097_012745 [Rhizopus azygosporus]|uniref:Uncharacterized protein n=1 Tax=Rhizopus azygosporus TaxID=86630 RepID=A0A367KC29_RHIAZ|nr:hypothetical protein CU097_012745 [Rhizopus azygosporus]